MQCSQICERCQPEILQHVWLFGFSRAKHHWRYDHTCTYPKIHLGYIKQPTPWLHQELSTVLGHMQHIKAWSHHSNNNNYIYNNTYAYPCTDKQFHGLKGHPSRPSFWQQFFLQSSSIHPYLVPKCSVNFPASVQADFHWAGLQMKAESHKIHTFK